MTSTSLNGLTQTEAARRLREIGPNELPQTQGRGLVQIALETMREPMFLLLLGAAILYMVLGDLGEGLFLLAGALATICLVIFQEARLCGWSVVEVRAQHCERVRVVEMHFDILSCSRAIDTLRVDETYS